ncbi:hypothetical protein N7540_003349 [Penicillium herquei]|nr:hypothetical protein N7540_003349 [Penicillium herquei]
MAQFLRDPDVLQADMIAIQEPWKNLYQNITYHPAKDTHKLLWPDGEERPRVLSAGEIRLFNIYNEDGVWGGLDILKDMVPLVSERRGTPLLPFPPITVQEISDVIRRALPDKAPRPDAIPNRVWKLLLSGCSLCGDLLTSIFDACVCLGYNPYHFQESTTVILRKGGPRDYRLPKSYRLIVLMNTLGKLLEAVVATRISYTVEEYLLLPKTHLGGRKGISVDYAIQLILSEVCEAWGNEKKVSMLLLDVSSVYNNVSYTCLLYNMRKLGLGYFVLWTSALLQYYRTATARHHGGWSPIEVLRWKKGQILYLDGSNLVWETRKSFILAPWEQRITYVIEDAEKARISAEKAYPGVPDDPGDPSTDFSAEKPCVFFTDGSGYEGHIGAAVVIPTELDSNLKRHLSKSDQSTVYLAELSGIELALESFLARLQTYPARQLVIFVDSQAAIQAVQNPKRPSGQFILCSIYAKFKAIQKALGSLHKPTESLQKPSPSVTIRWVPTHVGILGNEIADLAAKEAAKDTVGVLSELSPGGPRLATTARRLVRDRIRARWTLEWSRERTGQPNRRLTEVPEKKNLKIFEGLPRHYTSVLVQM